MSKVQWLSTGTSQEMAILPVSVQKSRLITFHWRVDLRNLESTDPRAKEFYGIRIKKGGLRIFTTVKPVNKLWVTALDQISHWTKQSGGKSICLEEPKVPNQNITLANRTKMICHKCGKLGHFSSQCMVKQGFHRQISKAPATNQNLTTRGTGKRIYRMSENDTRWNTRTRELQNLSWISNVSGSLQYVFGRRNAKLYRLLIDSEATIYILKREVLTSKNKTFQFFKKISIRVTMNILHKKLFISLIETKKIYSTLYTEKICRLKFNRLFEESWTESKIGVSLVRFQWLLRNSRKKSNNF